MGETTDIEWCDHTFNPWWGCEKISPACGHCYAETWAKRTGWAKESPSGNPPLWGAGSARRFFGEKHWNEPLRWNAAAEKSGVRRRVFCASMADWLEDREDLTKPLARLLWLIHETPNLDWLLLTKRPENWRSRMLAAYDADHAMKGQRDSNPMIGWWLEDVSASGHKTPKNVWIGTTVEDQQRAEERIPHLLKIPAKVRFLSCEPLLGPVNLRCVGNYPQIDCLTGSNISDKCPTVGKIKWVICGGESGPGARSMHADWARSLRDQCRSAGVPFLFKQWGSHDSEGNRCAKQAAGRLLDGLEHNEFPTP